MHIRSWQRGFSLVEVMMALGVLSLGGYALISLMKTSMNMQKGVTSSDDARAITADMVAVLTDPTACKRTFAGSNPSLSAGFSKTSVISGAPVPSTQYAVDKIYGNKTLKFKGLQVGGAEGSAEPRSNLALYTTMSPTSGIALVLVNWERIGTEAGAMPDGMRKVTRWFKINVTLSDATSRLITDCFAIGGNSEDAWKHSAADPTKIYYAEGNVGIGTENPSADLHIEGDDKSAAIGIINSSSSTSRWPGFFVANYAGSTQGVSSIGFMHSRGSRAAQLPTRLDDRLGLLYGSGSGQSGSSSPWPLSHHSASIMFNAAENFSYSSEAGFMTFNTTPTGASSALERMRIDEKGNVGIGVAYRFTAKGITPSTIVGRAGAGFRTPEIKTRGIFGLSRE